VPEAQSPSILRAGDGKGQWKSLKPSPCLNLEITFLGQLNGFFVSDTGNEGMLTTLAPIDQSCLSTVLIEEGKFMYTIEEGKFMPTNPFAVLAKSSTGL
jgi:hypothetical protein